MLVLVAACGGDNGSPLTREEYASRADEICTDYRRKVDELGQPSNLSQLADAADKTLPLLEDAIDGFKELEPPEGERATAEEWLREIDKLKVDLEEIRQRAREGNMAAVQAVVPKAQEHNGRSNELAGELGMSVCNSG
jgi:hypothetical protein